MTTIKKVFAGLKVETWTQLEFIFPEPKRKRVRVPVDYDMLYKRLCQGPVTFAEIEKMTGVKHNAVAQIITTLCIRYPVWSPARGVYKLCEPSDYE